MSSIVAPVAPDQAPLLARPYYANGAPGPIAGTMAHVPELLDVAMPFIGAALGPGAVSARLKEIAVLRASALLECDYCVRSHTVVALDEGLVHAEVRALRDSGPAEDAFTVDRERALVAWVDELATGRGAVDPVVEARMAEHFAAAEIVELTLVTTTTMMLNRYCTALGLPVSATVAERLSAEGLA
ncbi:MAG: carboxymuconolactone decarboxylase family protein [Solirubrobacterales bacterium]|nr:carboxymuconolactone decarboxylase family protein [Solirubrobacterales bacterium]